MTRLVANLVLLLALVVAALALVTWQYKARNLFVDLERAQAQAKKLEIEWNQLQLEQRNYSKHSLIAQSARRDLQMQVATPATTQFLSLPSKSSNPASAARLQGMAER